ncbi:hypothetical protein [Flavobacterium piscinae]|uniref:hypothetical protein n=1 Tax=Flavobacterium piscinae TaxID=2506424 RepID=UPI002AAAA226|nr:hypothetical protein [Flavobacterium piscinae]
MIQLKERTTKAEMLQQLPLIQQLYPEFTEQFYGDLLDEMLTNNYKQVVAFENEIAVGLSGFGWEPNCGAGNI